MSENQQYAVLNFYEGVSEKCIKNLRAMMSLRLYGKKRCNLYIRSAQDLE